MFDADGFDGVEVGYGSGDSQHFVVGSRREPELLHTLFEKCLRLFAQLTEFPDLP